MNVNALEAIQKRFTSMMARMARLSSEEQVKKLPPSDLFGVRVECSLEE